MWGLVGLPVPRGQFRARAAVLPQLQPDSDLTPGGDLGPVFMLLLSRPPALQMCRRRHLAGPSGQGRVGRPGQLHEREGSEGDMDP